MKSSLIAAAVVLASLIGWAAWSFVSAGQPVVVATVHEGEMREYVDERGMTRLSRTHLVTMPAAGRISAITLKEGDHVEKGQELVRLVEEDMSIELRLAEAAAHRAHAAVEESQDVSLENTARKQAERYVESMQHTVKAAEKRRDSGKARYEFSRDVFERRSNLVAENRTGGIITQEQLDEAHLQMIESDNNYQQDAIVLRALQAVQVATNLLPQMIVDYIGRKGIETKKLARERDQAQAQLDEVKLRHRRGVMKSPVTGVVLQRPIEHEQFLPAGAKLLEIGDLGDLEVEADILSQDVLNIQEGDAVEISGTALEKPLTGRVTRKYPAGFTKISSLGVEQQRVKVVIGFDDDSRQRVRELGLGTGYRVHVRIGTGHKPSALVVPRSALFRGPQGNWQVFAVEGRRAGLRDVQVGLMNDEQVEITGGLSAGDQVVVAPEAGLTDGTRVSASERS
jgi:HlyD family secretion protein